MAYLRLGHIKEAAGVNKAAGLKNCIDYIFNPLKTEDKKLIGGYNLKISDDRSEVNEEVYNRMLNTKIAHDKTDGRQGYHYKLSFPENENVSPELAMKITKEFCEDCFNGFECAFAIHTNTNHLHSHIVFNSVNLYDGYKYHYKNGDWAKIIQPAANRICEKYGLSSLELNLDEEFKLTHKCKDYGTWKRDKHKSTYNSYTNNGGKYTNADIRSDIDDCINISNNWLSFIKNMEERGHKVDDRGKYLKILAPGRQKWCRTYNLSDDKYSYTKEGIVKRIKGIPSLNYNAVKEKMFKEWKNYLSVIVIKPGNKLSIDELQNIEELNLLRNNNIESAEDMIVYKEYLNQADKMLNIYKKKINSNLAAKQKYSEIFDYIEQHSYEIRAYMNGNLQYQESYDKAKSGIKEIMNNGYEPAELYKYIKDCNKAIDMIDNYKKHIYVESKIVKRIESKADKIPKIRNSVL